MTTHERLYRPRPPTDFKGSMVARLDVPTNVVTFNSEIVDLRISDHLRALRELDDTTTELFLQ